MLTFFVVLCVVSDLPSEAKAAIIEYQKEAIDAINRHQKKVKPLEEKMAKEIEAKAKVARGKLEKLLEIETKSGNLETAVEIKAAMKSLKSIEAAPGGGLQERGEPPKDAAELNGHKYLYVSGKIPWYVARDICERMGGHLATINSAEEDVFVAKLLNGAAAWGGGSDAESEGRWVWITGEPFDYRNWNPPSPDNHKEAQHCLLLNQERSGRWDDMGADYRYGFVCEWE
jgi:hypothetical protein